MKLKEYLHNTGIKQNFLANKAGIHPVTFNLYVLEKQTPNIETAWKIHKATGGQVTFQDWLSEECDIDPDASVCKKTKPHNHT